LHRGFRHKSGSSPNHRPLLNHNPPRPLKIPNRILLRLNFRNKEIFGEDADTIRPETWLESSSEKIKEQEQTLELVFSFGNYKSLGQNLALRELNKAFVEINFDI
jgi:hypothetical protein